MIVLKFLPFINYHLNCNFNYTTCDLRNFVKSKIPITDFYLLYNGKSVLVDGDIVSDGTVEVVPRLRGGKGGFGSMLRAIGAQIEKTTNREACRDLSGRRLRDINEEKRLKKWIAEQADREREALEKKKKKLEKLASEPKHEFKDEAYDKARSELVDKVHSSVEEGMKAATSMEQPSTSQGIKRKKEDNNCKKKGMLWIDEELGSDLTDSDDDTNDEVAKKLKVVNS